MTEKLWAQFPCLPMPHAASHMLPCMHTEPGLAAVLPPAPVRAQVGPTEHAICALSGGVDSTVAATLVHRVLGDRLHCVFVDHGLLRYKVGGLLV
jgi:hypothetical protein